MFESVECMRLTLMQTCHNGSLESGVGNDGQAR